MGGRAKKPELGGESGAVAFRLWSAYPHITNLRKVWAATPKKAGLPYFTLCELRHTFATRLSAVLEGGNVAIEGLKQGWLVGPQ